VGRPGALTVSCYERSASSSAHSYASTREHCRQKAFALTSCSRNATGCGIWLQQTFSLIITQQARIKPLDPFMSLHLQIALITCQLGDDQAREHHHEHIITIVEPNPHIHRPLRPPNDVDSYLCLSSNRSSSASLGMEMATLYQERQKQLTEHLLLI